METAKENEQPEAGKEKEKKVSEAELIEGSEPLKEETEVNSDDARLLRSE